MPEPQSTDRDASLRATSRPRRDRPASEPSRIIKDPAQSEAARAFAVEAARSLADDKCEEVVVLDLRGLSQITDFFVVASGTSDRQMRSAGQHVEDLGRDKGMGVLHQNLRDAEPTWVILDMVDVIVHIFEPNARRLYDLEMLWGDAPRVVWRRDAAG